MQAFTTNVCSRCTDNTVPGISGHFSTFSKEGQLARHVSFGDVFVLCCVRVRVSQSVNLSAARGTNDNDMSRHGGCFPKATSTDSCVASCWRRWLTVLTFMNCCPQRKYYLPRSNVNFLREENATSVAWLVGVSRATCYYYYFF